ncbi:MAG: ATP-dependent DNA helicase [Alphaproteobacteria bacterium]|nr:ATP-dependent DNA helicase [Alphaproteobacteria bacterium]
MTGLEAMVRAVFEPDGMLSGADPHYKPRAGQIEMALAICEALQHKQALVVEAGTGVGKTFAYLVPALLSGQRVLVSTATKTLQDQLYGRDLPRLVQTLGIPVQIALLKGRANYLCLHRMELARSEAILPDRASVRALAKVEKWAHGTRTGDLAEMPGLDERSPLIPFITSNRDNCLGSECAHFKTCHLMAARRQALAAEVVVINHHLFFADLSVRQSGMAELLPTVDAVIFDEAHQLNATGVNFLGQNLSSAQWIDAARDVLAAGLTHARGASDWSALAALLEKSARDLRLLFPRESSNRLAWVQEAPQGVDGIEFRSACEQCLAAARQVSQAMEPVLDSAPDFPRLQERLMDLASLVERFLQPAAPGLVRWAEVNSGVRIIESPLDIAELFQKQILWGQAAVDVPLDTGWGIDPDDQDTPTSLPPARTWIFTSATLGNDDSLSWFTEPCGLTQARVLRVQSPFDYKKQGVLLVPRDMAPPQDPQHTEQVAELAEQVARALGGRTLVLTTTLRALKQIGEHLKQAFEGDASLEVLVQGEGSKRELMERFQQGGGTYQGGQAGFVLVASASFWEGFDVPGHALQAVVIDKLPFPPPNDPLVEARSAALQAKGRKPFMDYFIPEAAVALKQGAGRLIRRETDKGVLVVCDSRLIHTGYGKSMMAALPDMSRVSDLSLLLPALQRLRQLRTDSV